MQMMAMKENHSRGDHAIAVSENDVCGVPLLLGSTAGAGVAPVG